MIDLTIRTGLGSGIIINKKLYAGRNGGAGEFGMIDYLDKYVEYYASGQFFHNVYQAVGQPVFKKAADGVREGLKMDEEMGAEGGDVVNSVLYAVDVELIGLRGAVGKAWQ